jgi:hypothetical protein
MARLPIRRLGRCAAAMAVALVMLVAAGDAHAQGAALEYQVKAAFLAKFAGYVDWPDSAFESPTSPVNLCVAGDDPFGESLDRALSGAHIGGRLVMLKRLKTVAPNSGCHILYAAGIDGQTVAQALDAARGGSVLTVTDAARGTTEGIIHFVVSDDRVRFNIDNQTASQRGLTISSKLLTLALAVKPKS